MHEFRLAMSSVAATFVQDGTLQSDELEAIAVQADGTIVLAGTSDGGWGRLDDEASFGFGDFVVAFLTGEGEKLGGYQVGPHEM